MVGELFSGDPRYEPILAAVQRGELWEAMREAETLRGQMEENGEQVPDELQNWINQIGLEGQDTMEDAW
jgi:hypothetical protein